MQQTLNFDLSEQPIPVLLRGDNGLGHSVDKLLAGGNDD